MLISPMISRALDEPVGLEAAAMDAANAGDLVRLAAHALFDDWRKDPAVRSQPAKAIAVHSRSQIPALIDGESVRLDRQSLIRFTPLALRTLAPRPPAGSDTA